MPPVDRAEAEGTTTMTILCAVALALALLMTLLFIPVALEIRPVSGPDSMGLASVFFLSWARILCLTFVLVVVSARGGSAWLHPSRAVQAILLLLAAGAVAAMEVWSLDAATGWYGRAARPWVVSFSVIAPSIMIFLAAAALDSGGKLGLSVAVLRGAGVVLVVLLLAGSVDLARKSRSVASERRERAAVMEAEARALQTAKLAAFQALDGESRLEAWLAYTNDSDEGIRTAAVDSIRVRPRLREELAAILRGPDPLPALRWLWLWSQDRPVELAHALHAAAAGLPGWARARLDDDDAANDGDVGTACEALVVLAEAFEVHGVDYRQPIEALAAFLRSRALPEERLGEDRTYQARSMLQYWFDRHPGPEPRGPEAEGAGRR